MVEQNSPQIEIWKESTFLWLVLAGITILLGVLFYDGLSRLVHVWSSSEEYGYGFLIPVIAAFLIWQKKDLLEQIPFQGSWLGPLIVLAGIFGLLLGELSTLYIIIQYSLLVVLTGVVFALTGLRGTKIIWTALAVLVFMVPLPEFLYSGLSTKLQLISSEIGVAMIRLVGISVYLEGNVIDLGVYKLQVVEACSGLRYLFPLAALSFIACCIYRGAAWKRVVIFLSSLPITIFMNSFRLAVIGVLVEYGGIEQAEGFLHYFEGWIIFMACMAILIGEMWILGKIGDNPRPLAELFNLDSPPRSPTNASIRTRPVPAPLLSVGVILIATLVAWSAYGLDEREEKIPARADFSKFPLQLGEWSGRREAMEQVYIDALKFADYIVADYANDQGDRVNFYVAYYDSQRKGVSAHSPRSCLPGGGWQIAEIKQKTLDGVAIGGVPLQVNRVVIKQGEYRQLIYYWFQQRGRLVTNEYLVKWFLFWDSLWRQRTDGALIRLTAIVPEGGDINLADQQLTSFTSEMVEHLRAYVPD